MTDTPVSAPPPSAAHVALVDRPGFWRNHALLPLGGLLLVFVVAEAFGLDRQLAARLFAWEGHQWAFEKAFWAENVLHEGGRRLSALAWLCTLVAWVASLFRPRMAEWRRPLGYLVLAVLIATVVVSLIKARSNMDCPWDIVGLGGDRAYVPLYLPRPASMPHAACFPAGHSSGGYAWMALYFCFLMVRPAWRWRGLAVGIGAGLVFGITQQLRGAHFFTHDLATIMLCWGTACLLYGLFVRRRRAAPGASAG